MGAMGPLNRWVGSSAVVLANQAVIANNWSIIALKNVALSTSRNVCPKLIVKVEISLGDTGRHYDTLTSLKKSM